MPLTIGSSITIGSNIIFGTLNGQVAYTTPGTYSWTAPAGVTSVCVVCVGGGGSGAWQTNAISPQGGSGGGLGWKNNIAVTPGQTYTVVVGAGGAADRKSTRLNSSH